MGEAKRVIVTGVPGSGTTNFCQRYEKIINGVRTYNMGDRLLLTAQGSVQDVPIEPEDLLNLYPELLKAYSDMSFDQIIRVAAIDQGHFRRLLFDMHAMFFWNDALTPACEQSFVRMINADILVTMIEKPSTIKERLGDDQLRDLRDILLWQNTEVNATQGWARASNKPFYVLPGQQDPLTIESLLRSKFLIYFQMPMTDASEEADTMITKFKERLLALGEGINRLPTPLIDPRTIDIETGAGLSPGEKFCIRRQTVHRDMNWYITQASDLIAYYPPGTTISKGVSDESTKGFSIGKKTFVIYPYDDPSPFMDLVTRVFIDEEEFFEFFPDYLVERMELLKR